jgi:hypothetical protein
MKTRIPMAQVYADYTVFRQDNPAPNYGSIFRAGQAGLAGYIYRGGRRNFGCWILDKRSKESRSKEVRRRELRITNSEGRRTNMKTRIPMAQVYADF